MSTRRCQSAHPPAGANAMDATIAATALVHDLTVWTQDSDCEVLASPAPGLRVHQNCPG